MDLASFAFGLAAGVALAILFLGAVAVLKMRRLAQSLPLLAGFHDDARALPSGGVETDEEDHIIAPLDSR